MNDARHISTLRVLNRMLHGLQSRSTPHAAAGLLVALLADLGRVAALSPTLDALCLGGLALGALLFAYGAAPVQKDA